MASSSSSVPVSSLTARSDYLRSEIFIYDDTMPITVIASEFAPLAFRPSVLVARNPIGKVDAR